MAQYNSEQPNNENHDWQSVAGEFAAKIASRHTGMAERIVSRAATPIQRITLSARSLFPKIARKIAGKANWSGAFVNRVSALADRISRAVQLTPAEREPIERVWFAPDQALEPEFMEEETLPSPKPPEAPRAIEAMPPTRAARVERQPTETQPARTRAATPQTVRPAPRVQRSPIAKTIRFAAAKQSRLERTPLVGFSRPTLESMGILPSRPSIAQRSIPMPSSREEIELPLRHAPVIERTPAPVPPGEAPSISRAAETGIRHEEPVEIAAKPLPTVPAYLKRIQEPFVPASIRGPAIARESAFEEIGERKPVSVGFVPPMKAFEEEPPRPSIAEALPFRPPMRERTPDAESRAEGPITPPREGAAPPAPMRKRIEPATPPPVEHIARKPMTERVRPPIPQRPKAIIEEIGLKEPPAPIARAPLAPAAPKPEAPIRKRGEPGLAPAPGEPFTSPISETVSERPSPEPTPSEVIARAALPEPAPPATEEYEPSETEIAEAPIQPTIEPAPRIRRKADIESPPLEEGAAEPEAEEGLAETILRKYEPQEAAPQIMEKPLPSPSRPAEEGPAPEETEEGLAETILRKYAPEEMPPRIMEKPLPSPSRPAGEGPAPEAAFEETPAPGLAESIISRYETPSVVHRKEGTPLPVSTQRAFETFVSKGAAESISRKAEGTGEVPETPALIEGIPELPFSPQLKRAISRKPLAGAGEAFVPFSPEISREAGGHHGVPVQSYAQMAPTQAGPPEARPEGDYRLPELVLAPIGPRVRAEGEPARHIARAAEDRAATPATGGAAREGAPGEQPPAEGPDTEAIAREVYAIIRRRLTVERERMGRRNL